MYSSRDTFRVYMIAPDGRRWVEEDYEGYGVFGGKDIFELVAELNGMQSRSEGIEIIFKDNPCGSFELAAAKGVSVPVITEQEYDYDYVVSNFGHIKRCPAQGYFYEDEEE